MLSRRPLSLRAFDSAELFRRFVLFAAFAAALSLVSSTRASAQCDSWTGGGGDGNWSDGLNWSNGKEPGSSDNACIQSGAAVTLDVNDSISNLTIGSGNSLTIPNATNSSPFLNLSGSSLANSGQIILAAPVQFGSTFIGFTSTGTVTLSGTGTITLNANSFGSDSIGGNGILLNQSTIQGSGGVDMTINNSTAGVINANQSGVQLILGRNQNGGGSSNIGLLEATGGGQLVMGSLTLNNVGGTIKASGTNSFVQLAGQGQGGETFTGGTWTTASGGAIQVVDNSALLDGTNGNTIINSGTMQLVDGASHPGGNFQGTFNNTGTIQILSKGNGVGIGIPSGQTFTLMGTGSLTMGDGTDNSYNNQPSISGATFVNQSTVTGTGNILNLTSFTNSGTINANVATGTNNLQLQLGRSGASTNTGTIEATNGGVLLIGSTTINNVGGTIASSGTGSNVSLVGSLGTSGLTITGGTFNGSGGGVVYGQGNSLLDGTTSTVMNTGSMIINSQSLQVQGTLKNTGTIQILAPTDDNGQTFLQIPNGENLTITGIGAIVMGDGTDNAYNNNAAIGNGLGTDGTFDNQSTIEGTGGIVLTGAVTNDGTILANIPAGSSGLNLYIDRVGNIQNNGTIHATKGGVFYIGGGSCCGNPFTNAGTVTADANSTANLENANPFSNLANNTLTGGTYNVTGTLLIPGNIDTNAAKISLIGPTAEILNPNSNALAGLILNTGMGTFSISSGQNFTSSGTFTNQGSITIGKGSTFTVGAGGMYLQSSGHTTVIGKLTTSTAEENWDEDDSNASTTPVQIMKGSLMGNGGTIATSVLSSATVIPAMSTTTTGKLTITGTYTQKAVGALDANIVGMNAGQFNLLSVKGTAILNGTLNIGLLNGYVPPIGATFEILTARNISGTFATVNGTAINSSEHFTVTYNSNNVTLTVVSGT